MRPTLLLLILCMTLSVSHAQSPPKLPYLGFASWAVVTVNIIPPNGTAYEYSSVGMHVEVNDSVVCRFGVVTLFPYPNDYAEVLVANYTQGTLTSRHENLDGTTSNCTSSPLHGRMPYGGAYDLTPRVDIFSKMQFSHYAPSNGYNCSVYVWQGINPDGPGTLLMQWFLSVPDNVPQLLLNQTFFKDPSTGNMTSRITTTAYNGYHSYKGWNGQCTKPNVCGSDVCIANPAASDDAIEAGLQWVCSGVIDCTNITEGGSQYLPDTALAHGSWAFNQYYQQNIAQGPSACDFNGAAELVVCNTNCTVCGASPNATKAQLIKALSWVCGPQGIQDCSAIEPGGANFFPNTTAAHASWAFNVYYQGYKCIPGANACDFNNTGVILPCDSTRRQRR